LWTRREVAKDRREAVTLDPLEGALTTAELIELISSGGPFSPGSTVEGDEMIEAATEVLRHNAHPDYLTLMVSKSVTNDYPGVDRFRKAWSDWISPYDGFRIEVEDVLRLEDKLVFTVRQIATTRHNEVEVETPSASVWWFEKGRVRQAAFYLDRRAGLKAAGVDPPPSSVG
jgi:ketosteroid isomerase-like protein